MEQPAVDRIANLLLTQFTPDDAKNVSESIRELMHGYYSQNNINPAESTAEIGRINNLIDNINNNINNLDNK